MWPESHPVEISTFRKEGLIRTNQIRRSFVPAKTGRFTIYSQTVPISSLPVSLSSNRAGVAELRWRFAIEMAWRIVRPRERTGSSPIAVLPVQA
jgi:hypothetical protein